MKILDFLGEFNNIFAFEHFIKRRFGEREQGKEREVRTSSKILLI